MDLEQEVRRNTADIAAVTNTVTRLATVQENAEKQRIEDRELMRKAVEGMAAISKELSVTAVMQENIKRLVEDQGQIKSDVRTLRHDHANTKQAVAGLPLLGDKIGEAEKKIAATNVRADALEGRLNSLEAWRDKLDGASGALKGIGTALWAVFGTGIIAIGYFIFRLFFQDGGGK